MPADLPCDREAARWPEMVAVIGEGTDRDQVLEASSTLPDDRGPGLTAEREDGTGGPAGARSEGRG